MVRAVLRRPWSSPSRSPNPSPNPSPFVHPSPYRPPRADTSPTPAGAPPATAAPTWPCPACGNANAIELDACAVCGTSFAALMRQGEERPKVEPKTALAWSLIFPGLGHRKVGRGMDGLARGVLFAMLFVMALLTGLSAGGSGVLFGLFALFLGLAVVVYAGTAGRRTAWPRAASRSCPPGRCCGPRWV